MIHWCQGPGSGCHQVVMGSIPTCNATHSGTCPLGKDTRQGKAEATG